MTDNATPEIPTELWMFWHNCPSGCWLVASDETPGHDGPYLVAFSEAEALATIEAQRETYECEYLIPVRVK